MTLRPLPFLIALALTAPLQAQIFYMGEAAVNSCTGTLAITMNGANEQLTTTVCSNDPVSTAIALEFITFNLSTAGSAPVDVLFIYDGPDTSSPLIGQWSGTVSPGLVSASVANTSGCLTLVFTSNETGSGGFTATISCITPCQQPLAVATLNEAVPALVCPGEVLTFDGTASFGAAGFSIVDYAWDFGDGTTDESWPVVQHSYTEPGAYTVQLTVTDNNGCTSTNAVDLLVQVSGAPSFAGTAAQPPACVGNTVPLVAQVTAVGAGSGSVSITLNTPIPDAGDPLTVPLTVSGHEPGAVIGSIDEVPAVCVEMEHSYMGDLVIQVTCPNGQSVVFHEQGGGSTFIGGANDTDTGMGEAMGECWSYCWSPTATLGTFVDCAALGTTPNVTLGGTPPASALLPGTYSSLEPMDQLIGCPVDGTWTLSIQDNWAVDDGWLCTWGLELGTGPAGPAPGLSTLDSAFWSGPGVITDPATPLEAEATVTAPGVLAYTFTVTDNYGCTYDTTVTVTAPDVSVQAIDGPTAITSAGPVVYTVQGVGAEATSFLWTLPAGWDWANDLDPADGTALLQPPSNTSAPFELCVVAEGLGCFSATVCLQGDVVTGLGTTPTGTEARLFPNPTTGVVQVVRPTATLALLTVVDALGRTVHQHPMNSPHTTLDLSPLGTGAYVLLWWEGAQLHRYPVTVVR